MTAQTALSSVILASGVDIPNARVDSTDIATRQFVAAMNATGKELNRRAEWPETMSSRTFISGVSFDLPTNFSRLPERGAVRLVTSDDTYKPVRVVVAPEQWAFLESRESLQPYCHLSEGQLHFLPELDFNGAMVSYVTNEWVSGSNQITEDGDTFNVPEELVVMGALWRWKRQKGLPYQDELAEYEAAMLADIKAGRGLT